MAELIAMMFGQKIMPTEKPLISECQ